MLTSSPSSLFPFSFEANLAQTPMASHLEPALPSLGLLLQVTTTPFYRASLQTAPLPEPLQWLSLACRRLVLPRLTHRAFVMSLWPPLPPPPTSTFHSRQVGPRAALHKHCEHTRPCMCHPSQCRTAVTSCRELSPVPQVPCTHTSVVAPVTRYHNTCLLTSLSLPLTVTSWRLGVISSTGRDSWQGSPVLSGTLDSSPSRVLAL